MLVNINRLYGDSLNIPLSYLGPNHVYAVWKRQSGDLQQQSEPAFHLSDVTIIGAGQYSMHGASPFQHLGHRRQ